MTNVGSMPSNNDRLHAFVAGLAGSWSKGKSSSLGDADRQYLVSLLREHGCLEGDDLDAALLTRGGESSAAPEGDARISRSRTLGALAATGELGVEDSGEPYLRVRGLLPSQLGALESIVGAPPTIGGQSASWRGVAALDGLGQLLAGLEGPCLPSFLETFLDWTTRLTHLAPAANSRASVRVQRVHEDAVLPKKERVSDSGYDLTLLYKKKTHGTTTLYGTGIIIEPPHGWYFDVVPRSSIIKRGYMLANNVGIIDRSYRGEIFVPLVKIDPDADELELPARVAQLIPRPIVHFPVVECAELSETHRGAGGFGSTGK